MIQLDLPTVRHNDRHGEFSRPLWNAETIWQPRKSWRQWPTVIVDEFLHWYARHPESQKKEFDGKLHKQLPRLSRFAHSIQFELTRGTGVTRLAAPDGDWHESNLRRLYWVLGILMGRPIDTYGELYEVKDRGSDHRQERIPVSQTSASTSLHTDSSSVHVQPDLVGLLCLQPAREGGESRITSALTAHHRLHQMCPELLRELYGDFIRDMVTPGTELTIQKRLENRFPIFRKDPVCGLNFRYMRYWIETGQKLAGFPLKPVQKDALDALEQVLEAPGAVATFSLQPGEMLWLDNWTVAHDRTAYVDDPLRPRRLLRMWLDLPLGLRQCSRTSKEVMTCKSGQDGAKYSSE